MIGIEYMESENLSTEFLNFLLTEQNGRAIITLAKGSKTKTRKKKKGDVNFITAEL
jgi:hypothetical protein